MKIFHIAPNAYPFLGGIEVLLKNLTKHEVNNPRFEHVISFPDRSHKFSGEFKVEGTRVIPLEILKNKQQIPNFPAPKYRPSEIVRIFNTYRELLVAEKPSVIHFHDFSEASLPMLSIARSLGIPRVHHFHILIDDTYPKDLLLNLQDESNFIAVSEAVARSIATEIKTRSESIVIPNGLPIPDHQAPFIPQSKGPSVLMVGRFVKSKGFDVGLEVFAKALEFLPNLRLTIAGYGPEFNFLKRRSGALGISDYVDFVYGPHPSSVRDLIYRHWIVFVPSQSQEGFNLVAAEAALCGRAVLATNIGGLPETVLHDKTGFIAKHNDIQGMSDGLLKLLCDREKRESLAKNALIRAHQSFSLQKFADKLNSVYLQVNKGELIS